MFFNEIIHATQYYRSPTPLPEEWEGDIEKFEELGIGAFQIRINWRWNEIREGEYRFDDVDKLMELATKHGRRVVIKFLLECAPQYVFDKYGGTRIGPRGERLRGGAHGAFYGGWRPCFTNPEVQRAAARFVEEVAKRYKDHPNLMLWNAWNEIRNKPMEDCFCPHCRAAFGKHLRKKFGTVEALNAFYGTAEDSFENIALPAMPHGYWDIFEYKKFKGGDNLYEYLRFVYDAVRKHDTTHPVMSHVGFTTAFQDHLGDICDDYTVSKAVDFWGTSIPCDTTMDTVDKRLDFMMLNDYLRSIDKNYFLYEIYPGLGMFKYQYDTPFDMSYKLYTALSSGTKGLVYWQYRSERVGHEADCAGLVRADGSPRPVVQEVGRFGRELERNMKYLCGADAKAAQVAIAFDFNSMLISEIDDACGPDYHFEHSNPNYYYRFAHAGMYRLLRECNYNVDYVGVTRPELFKDYKVLYFPYYAMIEPEVVPYLEDFVRGGGVIVADEGFGLRQMNTWMQPYDIACGDIMRARMCERRYVEDEKITLSGERVRISPFKTEYKVDGGEALLYFDDGTPAAQEVSYGEGKVILLGFSIGYSAYEKRQAAFGAFMEKILADADIEKYKLADFKGGLYEKHTVSDLYETVYLFNNSDKAVSVKCDGAVATGGFGTLDVGIYTLPPMCMGYYVIKNEK